MRLTDRFLAYRHRMCAEDTAWAKVADWFIVTCSCCSFWRGALLGGLVGVIVGVIVGAHL